MMKLCLFLIHDWQVEKLESSSSSDQEQVGVEVGEDLANEMCRRGVVTVPVLLNWILFPLRHL